MKNNLKTYDAIVIGGGIFGVYASFLLLSKGLKVAMLEKENSLFEHASKINQSRVHRGYHYPRSLETAEKVANYYDKFCYDFNFALLSPSKQYYAVSKKNSKVSTGEYINFCKKLNIPLKSIDPKLLFNDNVVDVAFEVEEACFNYLKIKNFLLKKTLNNSKFDIFYETFPISQKILGSNYLLETNNNFSKFASPIVINTTYSAVNEINELFNFPKYKIKYELCELMLCQANSKFKNLGITVIDGPFFSLMPFGDGNIFSLSSVNHTPIKTSFSKSQYKECQRFKLSISHQDRQPNWDNMYNLAKNYLNSEINLKYLSSIFEIKPILLSSEKDDARPTVINVHSKNPFYVSVFAGKISTIYDLEHALNKIVLNLN